jgi:hypothetical protein
MKKISLMVLLSALSTLTVHAQESIESSSYTSEEGHFFLLRLIQYHHP